MPVKGGGRPAQQGAMFSTRQCLPDAMPFHLAEAISPMPIQPRGIGKAVPHRFFATFVQAPAGSVAMRVHSPTQAAAMP